ncbi:MAG: hypothetical protein AAF408_02935 [Pseudomonadota bacterium]
MKLRKKPHARQRGGALLLVAALMFGSATVRLGLEAGPALAKTVSAGVAGADPVEPVQVAEADREALRHVLDSLNQREARLAQREIALEDRAKALDVAARAVDKKLAALTEAEASLRETLAIADVAAEDDLATLTQVYENMKPKTAAALFEEMNPEFAAGFLSRMSPQAAAGIMAGLSPGVAYSVSAVLAGRNASVPKQ